MLVPQASGVMNMDQPSPDFAVDPTLNAILATQEVPRGRAANLYFAGTAFGMRVAWCGTA